MKVDVHVEHINWKTTIFAYKVEVLQHKALSHLMTRLIIEPFRCLSFLKCNIIRSLGNI